MTGGIGRVTEVLTNYFRDIFGWKVYSIYGAEAKADCIRTVTDGGICLRLHDRLNIRRDVKANISKAVDFLIANEVDVFYVQTSLDVVAKIRKEYNRSECSKQLKIISVLHFEPGKDEWKWGGKGLKGIIAPIRNWFIHNATVKAYKDAYQYGDLVSVLSESYIEKYKDYSGLTEGKRLLAMPNPLSFDENEELRTKTENKNKIAEELRTKTKNKNCLTDENEYENEELRTKTKDKNKIAEGLRTITEDEVNVITRTVLVVARMEESQKRISHILRMWKSLEDNGYVLKIVGDGPSLSSYKQLASELHLKNITFEGRQNPVPYYKEASIFLMTSAFEGFPMTLVEAQQFGCVPVVYDSFSALKDVVEHNRNGIIIPDRDEASFVMNVTQLMNDTSRLHTLAENAIADSKRFSQEIICNKWKNIIEHLFK